MVQVKRRLDKVQAEAAGMSQEDRRYRQRYTHRYSVYFTGKNLDRINAAKK